MITWHLLAASRSAVFPSSRFTASHYAVPTNPLDVSAVGTTVITTSQVLRDQNYSFTLPTTPKYSSTTTNLGGLVRYATTGASTDCRPWESATGALLGDSPVCIRGARTNAFLGVNYLGNLPSREKNEEHTLTHVMGLDRPVAEARTHLEPISSTTNL